MYSLKSKPYYGIWTSILARSNGLDCLNDGCVSYKHIFCFIRHLLTNWSGVDYLRIIVMFLSAVWTLNLTAPIHFRGSIGEKYYISPNLMKKQTHLHLGWPDGEYIFCKCSFSNYSFKPKSVLLLLLIIVELFSHSRIFLQSFCEKHLKGSIVGSFSLI